MHKKSQLTIFIIIVLMLIVVVGFFFYNNNKAKIQEIKKSEDVNLKEIKPVKVYIEDVLTDLVIEGFFLIGKQGGILYETTWPACKSENPDYENKYHRMCNQTGIHDYFSYPTYLEDTPYRHKRVNIGINDSRELTITRSSIEPLQQPFAYPHIGPILANDYLYGMNQPLPEITSIVKRSIEYQLREFVSIHLPTLLDFSELEKRGYEISVQKEYPRVVLDVNEDDISTVVYYNVTIEKSDIRYEINEFFIEIDYNFRRFYMFIQQLIQKDMTTLKDIKRFKMLDETGQEVGEVFRKESATTPPNYEYDLIYAIDRSFDWSKWYNHEDKYNPEPQYFTFYFLRENRAPDADTVYNVPEKILPGETTTWYCPNYKTAGTWFDPDEDDMYTEEFPFTNPQWYVWKSRGDYLKYEWGSCDNEYPMDPEKEIRKHTDINHEEDSEDDGITFLPKLEICGNKEYIYSTEPATMDDVGDVIILKVGDQMDFPISGEAQAPGRYPKGPITEEGSGRLNDGISFQPVKCNPSDECCNDEVWNLDQPPLKNPEKFEVCIKKCSDYCPSCTINCEPVYDKCCQMTKLYYKVCNHIGETTEGDTEEGTLDPKNCNCRCEAIPGAPSGTLCPT